MPLDDYVDDTVRICILEASDLETQLHYIHAFVEHRLRHLAYRALGRAAARHGSCVNLIQLAEDLQAIGLPLDPVAVEQLHTIERVWNSYLEHRDLRDYNVLLEQMPYTNRFRFADRLHHDERVRESWLTIPATRFCEVFLDVYYYLCDREHAVPSRPTAN